MAKFIYVFDEKGRDALLAQNYEMLKCNEQKHIYVFINQERQTFAQEDFKYALSDVLTFGNI